MKNRGFTLVELMAVITILTILLLIAVPTYQVIRSNINESVYYTKIEKVRSSATTYAEETGLFVFDIKTLIENGKLEADNEIGEYKDPRNNRNMACDILNMTFDNSQYSGEISESDYCYTKEELNNLYGMVEFILYQENREITETNGWIRGNYIEIGYRFKDKYKDYAAFVEEISWNGEESKSCTKEKIADCNRYVVETGEIKILTVTLNLKISKDGILFETKIEKVVRIDNQVPYVIKHSIVQNNNVNTQGHHKVDFNLSDGEGSGIASYAVITGTNCNSEEYEEKKITTNETHGTEYLANGTYYLCVTDKVGNRTPAINEDNTFTVSTVDVTKPIIKKFDVKSIIDGYHDLNVRLSIEVTDDRPTTELKMCISNADYLNNCSWEPYASGKNWTLNGSLDGGNRIIYLSVQDASGNIAKRTTEYKPYQECEKLAESNVDWSACSKTCGGGTQTRTYDAKDFFTGASCGNKTESQSCNARDCCSSTKIGSYGTWSACSKTCGRGVRYRDVNYVSTYNGQSCETVLNGSSEDCNTKSCIEYRYRDISSPTSVQKSASPQSETRRACDIGYYCISYNAASLCTKCEGECVPIYTSTNKCNNWITIMGKKTCIGYEMKMENKCHEKSPYVVGCPNCNRGELKYLGSNEKDARAYGYNLRNFKADDGTSGFGHRMKAVCGKEEGWYSCLYSESVCPAGATMTNNKCYGAWSNWSSTPVAASSTREVQTRNN